VSLLLNACACMGPQLGQPYCPCEMQRRGLSDGKEYEWAEADKERLTKALDKMFATTHPEDAGHE
jgi:hypothetical protein